MNNSDFQASLDQAARKVTSVKSRINPSEYALHIQKFDFNARDSVIVSEHHSSMFSLIKSLETHASVIDYANLCDVAIDDLSICECIAEFKLTFLAVRKLVVANRLERRARDKRTNEAMKKLCSDSVALLMSDL